jgi:predicted PurR-regulated permease PerM
MYACSEKPNFRGIQRIMSLARSTEVSRATPLLGLVAAILILFFARDLLVPFAFALMLAFLLAPAVARLEARRVPRVVAVAITGIFAFTLICGMGYVVAGQLLNVARELPAYRLNVQRKIASIHSPAAESFENAFAAIEGIGGDIATGAGNTAPGQPQPAVDAQAVRIVDPNRSQLQTAKELVARLLRPLATFGVVIVFTVYLLMERNGLRRRILLLAGMTRIRLMNQALQDAASRISQYLLFQVAVNAVYGTLFGAGLFLVGVPNATFWGVFAGILRIIPYAGTAAGLVLPLIVCVGSSPSWEAPLLLIGLFLALELTATNVVEPWLFSSRTGISSLALLVMAIFWTLLWGWPGLILSTPLTVCIVVLGRHVPRMSFLHALLGADAELSADARFYERLLAMDQQEARLVANRFLEGKTLVELYDSVVIPALALVEQDRHQGAFEEGRCNFFFLSIGELIAELTDTQEEAVAVDAHYGMQQDFAVVCIGAGDQADELTTHMLVQVLERAAHQTLYLPASVSDEILDSLANEPNTVVFVCALPPFAFSPARAVCQRIRSHLPQNRVVVALWNPAQDPEPAPDLSRFGSGRPTVVVNSLAQAVRQVTQWQQEAAGNRSSTFRAPLVHL